MGHSDVSVTMRVYTEVDDEQLKEAVNSLPLMQETKPPAFQILPEGGG